MEEGRGRLGARRDERGDRKGAEGRQTAYPEDRWPPAKAEGPRQTSGAGSNRQLLRKFLIFLQMAPTIFAGALGPE